MYSSEDFDEIIRIFKKYIPDLKALYLFGSYATGTATEKSDADIAVIVGKKPDWEERHKLLNNLWNELGEKRYLVDIIIKQETDFEKDRDLTVTLSHTIVHEGKVLWKKAA
ncbi:MAG: nucleotidyltransferase domain-containing protein [Chitinivibrionales bacterium]|nr:nucleotidyltransferase domain-containing protein [Chitinivibrionales bacterium]